MMKLNAENIKIDKRRSIYSAVATELALLSDQRLLEFIKEASPIGTSIGGTAVLLKIGDTNVFVKKIRLTDIERQPENIMSTVNLFDLPLYCQYGIGIVSGFVVWRELVSYIMTTNWILAGECSNFPLMYHWRLLPRSATPTADELKEMAKTLSARMGRQR